MENASNSTNACSIFRFNEISFVRSRLLFCWLTFGWQKKVEVLLAVSRDKP
jgi:hypothetical protein